MGDTEEELYTGHMYDHSPGLNATCQLDVLSCLCDT